MITIVDCFINQHDLRLVVVAALICLAGSWTAIRLYRRGTAADGVDRFGWLFLGATAAGSSIWCTHFIAMLAYEAPTGVSFNPVLTVISLLVAIVGGFAGLLIAGGLPFRYSPALGGGVFGLSIAAMHYIGMTAYVVEGVVDWDQTLTSASIAMAAALSGASIQIANRDREMTSKSIAVALMATGVVLLHFTGMAAFKVTPVSIGVHFSDPDALHGMAISVAMVGLIVLGAAFASYLIDGQTQARSLGELRRMALSDMLTGLSNRAHFTEELADKARRDRRSGQGFTLAAIDLDRFKEINDMRGHAAGDRTLVTIAERMDAFKAEGAHVFRIGGDEFIALVDSASKATAASLLARLRAAVIEPFVIDGYELSVGALLSGLTLSDGEAQLP